jgi:hypothetical protein
MWRARQSLLVENSMDSKLASQNTMTVSNLDSILQLKMLIVITVTISFG